MSLQWYVPFTKIFFVNISNFYAVRKIANIKTKEKLINDILMIGLCLIMGFLYTIIRMKGSALIAYPIYYSMFSIIYSMSSNSMQKGIVISLLANAVTIVSMLLASILNFVVMKIFNLNLNEYNIIEYITIGSIQLLFTYLFFKIKRFKDGFTFLDSNKFFMIIGIIISIILIIFTILIGRNMEDSTINNICTLIIILGGVAMFDWIKKSITKYYKEKMKERTVEIQQEQIKQQDEEIKNLQTELADVLQINHKYSHRISAMEKAVTKLGTKLQANEEFADEYGDILSSIKKLSKEYKEEVASVIKETKLPKTNIFSIDNLLEYMKQESEKDKIDFKLNLDFDINEILETKIPQTS